MLKRWMRLAAGVVLTFLGLVLAISPLPFGVVLAAFGAAMLIAASPRVAAWVRFNRTYNDTLDVHAAAAAKRLPRQVAEALEKTDPHRRLGP